MPDLAKYPLVQTTSDRDGESTSRLAGNCAYARLPQAVAEPYEYLTTLLVALLPCAAGVQIARWLLPGELRLLVLGGVGAGLGIGLLTFGVAALVQIVPLLAAALLVSAISGLLTAWMIYRWYCEPLRLGLGRWRGLVGALLLLVLFVAGVEYVASTWYGNGHENLFIRLGLAAHFAAGSWPPVNPFEPDTIWFYRFGGPLWAATVALAGGADVFAAGLAVTLVSVLALLWGVAAAVTLMSDRTTGILAAFLVAAAGPQNFIALYKAPFDYLSTSPASTVAAYRMSLHSGGYPHSSSFAHLVPFSYTVIVGLAVFAGVSALAAMLAKGRTRTLPSLLVGSVAFAGMSVTTEHMLPVLAALLMFTALGLLVSQRPRLAVTLAIVPLAGSALALIPEGPLVRLLHELPFDGPILTLTSARLPATPDIGGATAAWFDISLNELDGPGAPARSGSLELDASNLFTLPTIEVLDPRAPEFFFAVPEPALRVGLLDSLVWKVFGWVLAAVVVSVGIAALRRCPGLALPALGSVTAFLIPGVLHDELNPHNTWRFTQIGLLLAPVALAIVLTELWRWRWPGRLLTRLAAGGLGALAVGTWVVGLGLLPSAVYTFESPVLRDELTAARFAAQLPYPQRAVLLPGPQSFEELNSGIYDGMHKYAVTFGRLQVPMGFDNRGRREDYADRYAQAQKTLASGDLESLKIALVYTAQNHLTAVQRATLDQALAQGTLAPLFRSPSGARVIYRVVSDADG